MSARLELKGLDDLVANLRSLPADLTSAATPVVDDGAHAAAAEIRAAYPVRTGRLRASVRVGTIAGRDQVARVVRSEAPYARFYESGWMSRSGRHIPGKNVMLPILMRRRARVLESVIGVVERAGLMSVANLAAVDAALFAVLRADAALEALCPDGIYLDTAPAGLTRFVIVQHLAHEDVEGFGPALYERFVYLVKAVLLTTSGVDADGAAFRIHELLYQTTLAPIAGYTHMTTLRLEPVRYLDTEAVDDDTRWQHAGGQYEIYVSPN